MVMPSPTPLLAVENLRTHFDTPDGALRAVDGVSFSLNAGEILGLVGESGSGKSVTGFSILGLVDPPGRIVGGSIKFKGRELVGLGKDELRKLRGSEIAMIFQDPMTTLNPSLRIETQMVEAVRVHTPMGWQAARARALECLRSVGIAAPEERLRSYPHELSGGMCQRVVIATALLNEPDLIIADEPTTALDVTIQAQILHEVQKLCARYNTALIWITHDLSLVAGLAHKLCVMYAGRDVEIGSVDDVLDRNVHPYTKGLLGSVPIRGRTLISIPGAAPSPMDLPPGCAFAPRCANSDTACASDPPRTAGADGTTYRCFHPQRGGLPGADGVAMDRRPSPSASATPIVSVQGVTKTFGGRAGVLTRALARMGLASMPRAVHAVSDVSLDVRQGEVVSLVGESGCGKSTLSRMIAGIMAPTAGRITYDGKALNATAGGKKSVDELALQMVFQNPFASLPPRMRIKDLIGEAVRVHRIVPEQEIDGYVEGLLVQCGLNPSYKTRFPHQFSGGQRQRVGIARALAVKPRVLICDEPVSALDVSVQAQIINLFIEMRDRLNLTFLFVSHDLGIVEKFSDRVVVMYLGRIVEEAPTSDLFDHPRHPYTRALLDQVPSLAQRHITYGPLRGEIPSPLNPPSGCHFHPRCTHATALCREVAPRLENKATSHRVACHHPLDA
jgi:peptide/nickel transport system ATP-binding protein